MHRLPSRSSVNRFKFASWLLVFLWFMIQASIGVLIYSLVVADKNLTRFALGLIAVSVFVAILQWMFSSLARCPLCHAKSIARNGCSKHRNAGRLFGSYRLRVACSIICRQSFRCPYCGESTAIQARNAPAPRRRLH